MDEAAKRLEDEVARLGKDNELLRAQLAQMSVSIQVGPCMSTELHAV